MTTPRNKDDIVALKVLKIGLVVTLTKEQPLDPDLFYSDIANMFMPVENYNPPSESQADEFIWNILMEREKNIVNKQSLKFSLVHCGGGKGRAGTCIAIFLLRYGLNMPPRICSSCLEKQGNFLSVCTKYDVNCALSAALVLSAKEAVDLVRKMREGSIETKVQESFVSEYSSILWKRYSNIKASIAEAPDTHNLTFEAIMMGETAVGKFTRMPSVILLVGIPGSGKSWFSSRLEHLTKSNPRPWTRISQDDLGGSRDSFEKALSMQLRKHNRIIIDRCNPTKSNRKYLLDLLLNPKDVMSIYFNYSSDECLKRVKARTDHPTISFGKGYAAVKHFKEVMEVPDKSEKFTDILTVKTFRDSIKLLEMLTDFLPLEIWNNNVEQTKRMTGFFKYPRTPHLINLGAATADDLVLNNELEVFFTANRTVAIEEKVDGANLGFSLSEDVEILVQNRSHYVNSSSHQQFKKLDKWINDHRSALYTILGNIPRKYILFGEWMYAKHSIHYTELVDYFIAFDIYDCESGKFYSRKRFLAVVENVGIHHVPTITVEGKYSKDKLLELLKSKSQFSDSCIEGLYIRVDDEDWRLKYTKIVRFDFLAGNQHWMKNVICPNELITCK